MATLVTLVDHTIPVAADFNDNYSAINTEVRPYSTGGTGQSSWAKGDLLHASATNTLAKLAIGPVPGTVLATSSSGVAQWGGALLYKSGADVTISNSTTETSLLSLTVPAGALGTANCLHLSILGQVMNATGSSVLYTYSLKYGGSTIANAVENVGTGADRISAIDFRVVNDGVTDAQLVDRVLTGTSAYSRTLATVGAVDSTAAQTLEITMTIGTASSNATYTKKYATVRLIA